ncbi:sulfatase-like hydrolase/transferase [Labrenzia sp. VG12]|uniref:sulfatase-like hydrolase/transferase n=1 Tax=Labrenzia sp. VG12 TaxID=2021862 RepID=UPI000B8BCD77|nr:sulfatase-like hydrolase/transferase [Labrenzia sp. VG12]ASP34875.1 hypothetical protein CHH27_17865 [Labrenzia sp. VG12]
MSFLEKLYSGLKNRRFFTRDTLMFAFLAVLVPNAIYIFLSLFYCPFRTLFVLLLSFVCLIGLYVHRALFFVLLLAVMTVDALVLISNFFQMPLPMLFDSLRYAGNLSIQNSTIYLAAIGILLVSFALTYWVVSNAKRNKAAVNILPFFVVLAVYAGVDYWANAEPQEAALAKSRMSETYVPIDDAASLHSDVDSFLSRSGARNVLIVMVEGLGAFADPALRDTVWGPLLGADVAASYDVEGGSTIYFGSTTSGEVRELCHLKADYRDFRDRVSSDCLPARALKAGYRTAAFHAFTGTFFERFDWYPKIGFQDLNFLENKVGLAEDRSWPHCGVAFRGYCDTDVAGVVKDYLIKGDGDRKFAYWLTLNSHKPVQPGEVPARLGCDDGGVFNDVELCRMAEQWLQISHLVKDIALDPDLVETDIVLVGDHHPPLFTRSARKLFKPGKVAWLHLSPKAAAEHSTLAASYGAHR